MQLDLRPRVLALAGAVFWALCFAAACSSTKKPPVVLPADDLYKTANDELEKKHYEAAVRDFKLLIDNYPLDPRAEEVEFKIAIAQYEDRLYPEAIAALSDFQRMHPTSPELPQVEYTIGLCYMGQIRSVDRDLSAATNAAARFQSVFLRYPKSDYAEKARSKYQICREHLAERQLYIARFYFSHRQSQAGRSRVKSLLATYPETVAAKEGVALVAADARRAGDEELVHLADAALAEGHFTPPPQDPEEVKPGFLRRLYNRIAGEGVLDSEVAREGSPAGAGTELSTSDRLASQEVLGALISRLGTPASSQPGEATPAL